jgi:hypothetical protein
VGLLFLIDPRLDYLEGLFDFEVGGRILAVVVIAGGIGALVTGLVRPGAKTTNQITGLFGGILIRATALVIGIVAFEVGRRSDVDTSKELPAVALGDPTLLRVERGVAAGVALMFALWIVYNLFWRGVLPTKIAPKEGTIEFPAAGPTISAIEAVTRTQTRQAARLSKLNKAIVLGASGLEKLEARVSALEANR